MLFFIQNWWCYKANVDVNVHKLFILTILSLWPKIFTSAYMYLRISSNWVQWKYVENHCGWCAQRLKSWGCEIFRSYVMSIMFRRNVSFLCKRPCDEHQGTNTSYWKILLFELYQAPHVKKEKVDISDYKSSNSICFCYIQQKYVKGKSRYFPMLVSYSDKMLVTQLLQRDCYTNTKFLRLWEAKSISERWSFLLKPH